MNLIKNGGFLKKIVKKLSLDIIEKEKITSCNNIIHQKKMILLLKICLF